MIVIIYPNPVDDYCYLSLSNNLPIQRIKIYDNFGRLTTEINNNNYTGYQLNTYELMNGIYKLEVEDITSDKYSSKISIIK
ncbi:MAG: T9SS type A sorting domain-containing protein [Saprospiraceae bacterium]|nr:T9SS type A sorting domain-containing protein [Saprospiraceae bacterium]